MASRSASCDTTTPARYSSPVASKCPLTKRKRDSKPKARTGCLACKVCSNSPPYPIYILADFEFLVTLLKSSNQIVVFELSLLGSPLVFSEQLLIRKLNSPAISNAMSLNQPVDDAARDGGIVSTERGMRRELFLKPLNLVALLPKESLPHLQTDMVSQYYTLWQYFAVIDNSSHPGTTTILYLLSDRKRTSILPDLLQENGP